MISGEGYALLAALAYGLAGVTIVRGKATARGDNGVFLSILVTAAVSGALWLGWGRVSLGNFAVADTLKPVVIFVVAGFFSTVLGRAMMYRATERSGPVATSLLRRLTPVFALPLAYLLLAEVPNLPTLAGAGLVIGAVLIALRAPMSAPMPDRETMQGLGWILGVGSALFYAAAYALRSYGLDDLPDATLGTLIGAVAGLLWFVVGAAIRRDRAARLRGLLVDRGAWHWVTACALSIGQLCQFFALETVSVVVVATLGSLELFFTALLGAILIRDRQVFQPRFLIAAAIATIGTALLTG